MTLNGLDFMRMTLLWGVLPGFSKQNLNKSKFARCLSRMEIEK